MSVQERLQAQADRIESVLETHAIPARVSGGTVTPRWTRFHVLPVNGASIACLRDLGDELAEALDTTSCRIARRGAALEVEVARDDAEPVRLSQLYALLTEGRATLPPLTSILGMDDTGGPLLIRLPSPDVTHVLIAGEKGAGKSQLLQTMVLSLALTNPAPSKLRPGTSGLRLVLIDLTGETFDAFHGLPHLAREVVTSAAEAEEALESLVLLVGRLTLAEQPPVVVAIDGLARLLEAGGKPVCRTLSRLTQRSWETGVHVVAATDRMECRLSGGQAVRLLDHFGFPARLVGRVSTSGDAFAATGWRSSGAEHLSGRGDFLAVAEGRLMRFQAAHVSRSELDDVVARLGARCAPWLQPEILQPQALPGGRP
jgi:S-DNA-T family DNA segregation ATPase FtsK/SpoIIIE